MVGIIVFVLCLYGFSILGLIRESEKEKKEMAKEIAEEVVKMLKDNKQ